MKPSLPRMEAPFLNKDDGTTFPVVRFTSTPVRGPYARLQSVSIGSGCTLCMGGG